MSRCSCPDCIAPEERTRSLRDAFRRFYRRLSEMGKANVQKHLRVENTPMIIGKVKSSPSGARCMIGLALNGEDHDDLYAAVARMAGYKTNGRLGQYFVPWDTVANQIGVIGARQILIEELDKLAPVEA